VRPISSVVLGACLLMAVTPMHMAPAIGAPGKCAAHVNLRGQSAHAGSTSCASSERPEQTEWSAGARTAIVKNGPVIRYRVEYVQACTPDQVRLSNCIAADIEPCATGGYPVSRRVVAVNGPRVGNVVASSAYCGPEPSIDIPGAEEDIARVTPARFREFPILGADVATQPDGFSLRNGHAHMWAKAETQTFETTIFDQSVRVRAIPSSYTWNYGDGSSRTLNYPGEPVQGHDFSTETPTSHVYEETGDYDIQLATNFRGEYSTEGGPWTPIPGVASVASPVEPISVWRTKKILVDMDCAENPGGPGCESPFEQ
jgi:hypothetical protein